MIKRTSKSPKLRDFICVICDKPFQNYFSPADIRRGCGKVCSKPCKNILNGNLKRKGAYRTCIKCSKQFWASPSYDTHHKRKDGAFSKRQYCSLPCYRNVGQKFVSHDGYYIVNTPKGQMKEHRWLIEQHLGRDLLSSEIVHHINWDKLDNRIENLQILSRAEHNRIHCLKANKYPLFTKKN